MLDDQVDVDGLSEVARHVANAFVALGAQRSMAAVAAEIQLGAALEALESAGADTRLETGPGGGLGAGVQATGELAQAERLLTDLPWTVRAQFDVCAAAAYLRRARRVLA